MSHENEILALLQEIRDNQKAHLEEYREYVSWARADTEKSRELCQQQLEHNRRVQRGNSVRGNIIAACWAIFVITVIVGVTVLAINQRRW